MPISPCSQRRPSSGFGNESRTETIFVTSIIVFCLNHSSDIYLYLCDVNDIYSFVNSMQLLLPFHMHPSFITILIYRSSDLPLSPRVSLYFHPIWPRLHLSVASHFQPTQNSPTQFNLNLTPFHLIQYNSQICLKLRHTGP